MSAPAIDPADVLPDRYVPRRAGGERVAHLLTTSWQTQPGGHRPAVCGARARTWQNATLLADPAAPTTCPNCLRLSGRGPKLGPTVRLAPAAVQSSAPHRVGEPARPPLTAAQRAARRSAFAAAPTRR